MAIRTIDRGPLARVAVAALLAVSAACNAAERMAPTSRAKVAAEVAAAQDNVASDKGAAAPEGGASAAGGPVAAASADAAKMIVYTAEIALVVDELDDVESRLAAATAQSGAYVATSEVSRIDGARRHGRWTLRVPAQSYEELLTAVGALGRVESSSSKATDVTAEYVDVEAQASAKRNVEKRLVTLLATQTGKIGDVLEVERELGRVREEIDRLEGRMRYLKNQAAYSTVTLDVTERPGYEPPPAEPTLVERIRWAWKDSVDGVVRFTKGLIILMVRLAPWTPFFFVVALTIMALSRRRKKRRATREPSPPTPTPVPPEKKAA